MKLSLPDTFHYVLLLNAEKIAHHCSISHWLLFFKKIHLTVLVFFNSKFVLKPFSLKTTAIYCSQTEMFSHTSLATLNTISRYPTRFDIVKAKFGIDLIRMKAIDKMKHHMETYCDTSEKGQELEMTFIGVQEQCEAHNWPEGGEQILNLGHNLFPKSEVCMKIVRIKIALSKRKLFICQARVFLTVMHHMFCNVKKEENEHPSYIFFHIYICH